MQTIALQVFYGLLVELIIVLVTFWVKENTKAAISILAVGTLIAAFIAFYPVEGPPQGENPGPATSPPVEDLQFATEPPAAAEALLDYTSDISLTFTPCTTPLACPEATKIWDFLGQPDPYDLNAEFMADVPQETTVRFSIGWCTKEQQLLYEHLPHIQFVFAIDGLSYASELDTQYEVRPTEEDPTTDQYCYLVGTGISNWQPGVTYQIKFGMIMDTDLFDGWDNFTEGDYLHTYLLTGQ